MYLRIFVVATILCTLQCSVEVESFEVIKNALKNVATKVHNFVHPNHIHNAHCKHSHGEIAISTTTSIPEIDIRGGIGQPISGSQTPTASASSTPFPDNPDAIPNIGGKALIGVGCPSGTREVNGQCRSVVG